ncbi:hypothetical protein [Spirillospora sp. CA-128828]|uniref:hypothetical protein n=1 Tax=Spirillospora sp. CA-128828 TaxID=3240033 RepID=UPI003D8A6D9E
MAHIAWELAFGDRMTGYGHNRPELKTVTLTNGRRLAVPVQRGIQGNVLQRRQAPRSL